jgi:uncharacterized protein YacL
MKINTKRGENQMEEILWHTAGMVIGSMVGVIGMFYIDTSSRWNFLLTVIPMIVGGNIGLMIGRRRRK